MIDAAAVAWKEWRELLGQRGLSGKMGVVLFVAMFGVFLPLQNGAQWISSPAIAITWSWAPMFLVMNVISDAIAGERERHTLETLLASRLSDGAILFGKIGASVGYAAAVTSVCLLLGVVTVNIARRADGLLLYPMSTLLMMCALGVLGALLVAAVGVLISLRAATVRQAQQALSGAILVLLFVPIGLARLMPADWKAGLASASMSGTTLAMVGVAVFAVVDTGVVMLTMRTFKRSRLIAS